MGVWKERRSSPRVVGRTEVAGLAGVELNISKKVRQANRIIVNEYKRLTSLERIAAARHQYCRADHLKALHDDLESTLR